jgi:hypothetical protein
MAKPKIDKGLALGYPAGSKLRSSTQPMQKLLSVNQGCDFRISTQRIFISILLFSFDMPAAFL